MNHGEGSIKEFTVDSTAGNFNIKQSVFFFFIMNKRMMQINIFPAGSSISYWAHEMKGFRIFHWSGIISLIYDSWAALRKCGKQKFVLYHTSHDMHRSSAAPRDAFSCLTWDSRTIDIKYLKERGSDSRIH